jgi:hypothetical protein
VQEVETALVDCVERGAGVEADALASAVALLPPDLQALLPQELRAALGRAGAPAASAPSPTAAPVVDYAPMPAATLETNQIGETASDLLKTGSRGFLACSSDHAAPAAGGTACIRVCCEADSAAVVAGLFAAAEMADLRDAVRLLRGAVDALAANAEPAQDKVLRLNVREARGSLALRVQQLSRASTASLVGPLAVPLVT